MAKLKAALVGCCVTASALVATRRALPTARRAAPAAAVTMRDFKKPNVENTVPRGDGARNLSERREPAPGPRCVRRWPAGAALVRTLQKRPRTYAAEARTRRYREATALSERFQYELYAGAPKKKRVAVIGGGAPAARLLSSSFVSRESGAKDRGGRTRQFEARRPRRPHATA